MKGNRSKFFLYCSVLFLYICLLYGSTPFVREIQKLVSETVGRVFFTYLVIICFVVFLAFGIRLTRNSGRASARSLWLLGIFGIYLYLTLRLSKAPEEAIHFVEYGVLGALVFVTLSEYVRDITVYFTSALIVFVVGLGDELIQWVTPSRYWGFRDIGLNFIGGALMLSAIWLGVRPKKISERVSRKSFLISSCVFSGTILILGLSLSVTPSVAKMVSSKVKLLSFVESCEIMMPEYGKRHFDPEIGIFFSKFNVEELRQLGDQVSTSLPILGNDTELNLVEKKFLAEAREHLMERNRLVHEAVRNARVADAAHRENHILEKYFGKTMTGLGERWSAGLVRDIQQRKRSDGIYVSPVSADCFTRFSLKQAWTGILIILGLLWALNMYLHVRDGKLFGNSG